MERERREREKGRS